VIFDHLAKQEKPLVLANALKNSRRNHQIALGVTTSLALVIAYLTLTPMPNLSLAGSDKTHHLIAFATLTMPAAALYRRALAWLFPSAIVFGGLIEVLQPYVNRHGEWADFIADALGAILGVILGLILRRLFRHMFD